MPLRCCVPKCRGNYSKSERVSVFLFPTDEERKRLWLSKIPRSNFTPSERSVVCENHFHENFIVRIDSVTRPDGSILSVERERPKLTTDAYPSIFPNCPSYLSSDVPVKRKAPNDRRKEILDRDNNSFVEWLETDKIKDFHQFSETFKSKVNDNLWMYRLCCYDNEENSSSHSRRCWSFYRILDSADSAPHLACTLKIFEDMHVEIFTEKNGKIPSSSVYWIFHTSTSTLATWSQFDTLLSHFANSNGVENKSFYEQLSIFITGIQELCDIEALTNASSSNLPRYLFLVEQMMLVNSSAKRYSSKTLLWAFHIFAKAPRAYSILRRSLLTLPHPSYLRKMCSVFDTRSGFENTNLHQEYLTQKSQKMPEKDRDVILMLDEIHISSQLSYKSGRLEGSAYNCTISEANSAQVFMISSILSKSKDVVAIVPVKHIDASYLHNLIFKVLQILHKTGFHVVCIISDNNRINRNAFKLMSGGNLKPYISNPVAPDERLFFLFDTVHLFKCIRNNWLAQKDIEKTFMFPPLNSSDPSPSKASFSHISRLYNEESSSLLKLAPRLNMKCLNPTSTEKQNVDLMLRVFDSRNVTALEHYDTVLKTDSSGTRTFLSHTIKLWNILNVKHPLKGLRLRDENCKPVTSTSEPNIVLIKQSIQWLENWKTLNQKPREGSLSRDTMDALHHTLSTFVELINYLLCEKQLSFVLLGKFQTDDLEFRFCQYRQMAGSNYHVSVQQVLEGEKKLKLLSALKMVSASNGSIRLKDLTDPLEEVTTNTRTSCAESNLSYFIPLLCDCDEYVLSSEQLKVLVFVSGYCIRKAIGHTDCQTCKSNISTNQRLQVDISNDCHSYIAALDRGGLMWPSDNIVQIVSEVFKVFQILIKETVHEEKFISCGDQKQLVLDLAMERLSTLGFLDEKCEECDSLSKDVILKCCKPAVNILLNNYSKRFSDKASKGNNVRKLKTVCTSKV